MKTVKLRALLCALLVVFGIGTVHADIAFFTSKVTRVYPLADGRFILAFADQPATCTNTAAMKSFYVQVGQQGVTTKGADYLYAAALSAAATGATVIVYFDTATAFCFINKMAVNF